MLEYEKSYVIENQAKMIHIHDIKLKYISECNLLYDSINTPKRAKNIDTHHSPILHGLMNTIKGRAEFKNLQIILDSEFSYTIVLIRLVEKLYHKKDAVTQ